MSRHLPALVLDYDDTVAQEHRKLDSEVGQTLTRLGEHFAIVILSARATDKSIAGLHEELQRCELGGLTVFTRNMSEFDNSPGSLFSYKTAAMCELRRGGHRLHVGIGDQESDMLAYKAIGIPGIKIDWFLEKHSSLSAARAISLPEDHAATWRHLEVFLRRTLAGSFGTR